MHRLPWLGSLHIGATIHSLKIKHARRSLLKAKKRARRKMQSQSQFAKEHLGRALQLVFLSLIAGTVSACGTVPKIVTAEELCKDWRRIEISKNDRFAKSSKGRGTDNQIEANNETRAVWGCDRKANKAAS